MADTLFKYSERVCIAISVLFNVILGGYSNQSFSARNYQWKKDGRLNLVFIIDWIFLKLVKEHDHCLTCWSYWYIRKYKEES